MLTTRPVKRRFGAYLCRDCLNREYHANLAQEDVIHKNAAEPCPYCYSTNYIVRAFKPSGMMKMLFKH